MRKILSVALLLSAFYLGAHSQKQGPTFVTGISVLGGAPLIGQVEIRPGSHLQVSAERYNGQNILRIDLDPWSAAKLDKIKE